MKKQWTTASYIKLGILAAIIILIVATIIRIRGFFQPVEDDYIRINPDDLPTESEDYYVPPTKVHQEHHAQDDVTTIMILGDDSFAADRSDNGLAAYLAKYTGATIYNCALEGTSIANKTPALDYDTYPLDSFSAYRITACLQHNKFTLLDYTLTIMPEKPDYFDSTVELIKNIDLDTVDIIILSYGINDYLAGHITTDVNDEEGNVASVFGALTRTVRLYKEFFPHIQIVISSPAYAYYTEEDGSLIGGDLRRTGTQTSATLGDYMINMKNVAVNENVTFIDNYFGVPIYNENAQQYLTDSAINLNEDGRKLVASHIADVLINYVIPQ